MATGLAAAMLIAWQPMSAGAMLPGARPSVTSVTPNAGPPAGGTHVRIEGSGFTNVTAVWFGSLPAQSFSVIPPPASQRVSGPTEIAAVSPKSETVQTVDVTVTAGGRTSVISAADQFSYVVVPPPTVTSVTPGSGPMGGGTVVHIIGTNFIGVTRVLFRGIDFAGAAFTVDSPTQITAIVGSPRRCPYMGIDGLLCANVQHSSVLVTAAGGSGGGGDFTFSQTTCTNTSVTSDKVSPQPPGSILYFTVSAQTCGNPFFEFYTWGPDAGWVMRQHYGVGVSDAATGRYVGNSQYALNTLGMAPGTYTIEDWAAESQSETLGRWWPTPPYETFGLSSFVVGACTSATLSPNPAPSTGVVHFIATADGSACDSPQYSFLVWTPDAGWSVKQPYSALNSFDLDTASLPGGPATYSVEVQVRQRFSALSYETLALSTVAEQTCGSATLTPLQPSPKEVGGSVDFTASAPGCSNPEFRFWVSPGNGGGWQMLQDYSPSGVLHWNTAGLKPGTYSLAVHVRQAGSTAAYDTYALRAYSLTGCTTATLSPNLSAPRALGTPVTLTASATGCSSPLYQFWASNSGGTWQMLRDYGSSPSITWTPRANGTYSLVVDVKQRGSGAANDTFQTTAFRAGPAFVLTQPSCDWRGGLCYPGADFRNDGAPGYAAVQVIISFSWLNTPFCITYLPVTQTGAVSHAECPNGTSDPQYFGVSGGPWAYVT